MDISSRLKEERERLGLTQTAFGELGGMGKTTVIAWERGTAYPNAAFLAAIARAGADVLYILIGDRAFEPPPTLTADERTVVAGYRLLDARGKAGVLGLIGGITNEADLKQESRQVFRGPVGQVLGGDAVNLGTVTVHGGKSSRKK